MLKHIIIYILKILKKYKFRGRAKIVLFFAKILGNTFEKFPLYIGDYKKPIYVNLKDNTGIAMFLNDGLPHEVELKQLIFKINSPELNFWDIGSNYGYYPWLFINELLFNSIYCFEPNPLLKAYLDLTFKSYSSKVSVFNYGLSYEKGEMPFYINKNKTDIGSFNLNEMSTSTFTKLVKVDKIDFFREKIGKPDVMKIDVEGFEYNVLRGYTDLNVDYPLIFMEWIPSLQTISFELLKTLFDSSWFFFRIKKDGTLSQNIEELGSDIIAISKNNKNFLAYINLLNIRLN